MEKNRSSLNMVFLIFVPFIVSITINRLTTIGKVFDKPAVYSISETILNVWLYTSIIYWYWVGKKFGILGDGRKKSFIFGNSLWGIGLLFYVIAFYLIDESSRLQLVEVAPLLYQLAQGYSLGFIKWSSVIISPFTNNPNSNVNILISYILMLAIFAIGFYRGKHRKFI